MLYNDDITKDNNECYVPYVPVFYKTENTIFVFFKLQYVNSEYILISTIQWKNWLASVFHVLLNRFT